MSLALHAAFVGIVATGFMDLVAFAQRRFLGVTSLSYAMVGRWIGHIPKGRLIHRPIGESAALPCEAALGWASHYLIGMVFAATLLLLAGADWAQRPGPIWPVSFGAGTVAAPFLLLQPGMGAGMAARGAPKPAAARWRSVSAHVTFGVGLWLGAWSWTQIAGG
ncbi:Protein of unknown function [Faunimonas pinastri]|uniref:DUF2938 domain-containing protein n=1 Tax=Faunimonas pinastri TaxID=1855383 RepID=A0A1H9EEX8_9HYPH|nr:DUF2938 family protein [Faunimonas pinastri]SEQ24199.1 Protein of unknown function [Faunimonas pinastri]